jgi:hypothetical protein
MVRPAAGDRPFSRNCNIAWGGREFNRGRRRARCGGDARCATAQEDVGGDAVSIAAIRVLDNQ